ncbi:MAG: hypothetical protein CR982_02900 [Candidatus Cloacimonadota bacterium]|nr:MAG: hypothetical protein CR982_02900 [Candidatus Cloacimonadota bacterium]PIE79217.1 MAG: hypothetical protein CSA15_04095 [Candidatus Delongbacteria bacterium]
MFFAQLILVTLIIISINKVSSWQDFEIIKDFYTSYSHLLFLYLTSIISLIKFKKEYSIYLKIISFLSIIAIFSVSLYLSKHYLYIFIIVLLISQRISSFRFIPSVLDLFLTISIFVTAIYFNGNFYSSITYSFFLSVIIGYFIHYIFREYNKG